MKNERVAFHYRLNPGASMKAVVVVNPGGYDKLGIAEVADPQPGRDKAVVDVSIAGCNWGDTQIRSGTYSFPVKYPIIPGYEAAGIVSAVGPDVQGIKLGDRVAALLPSGGYAQKCLASADMLIALPQDIEMATAAAFPIQALTAYHMLFTVFHLRQGDTALIHAIGGGVGLYCTQLAVRAGARVIGTVGTPGKEKLPLAYGAEKILVGGSEDFVTAALTLTGGKGVDLLIDSLGGKTLDRSFAAVRALGHLISIGEAQGAPLNNIRQRLMERSQTFTRFSLGKFDPTIPAWRDAIGYLLRAISDGWLKVPIEAIFPFDQSPAMHRRLESRRVSGKLLLAVGSAEHSV
jgi:NADPH:quinone reductase